MYRPIVLVVLDGWGESPVTAGNPLRKAKLPTFETLNRYYPRLSLQASGIAVGLPWNTQGNSEVGHMTMGAGRVIYQNLPRIALSIQDGTFMENPVFLAALENVKTKDSALHLMGLVSEGSVHSHKDHLFTLLKMAKDHGLEKVFIHAFTDGRDSSPTGGIGILRDIEGHTQMIGVGKIASIIGRNWAMDRNNNWDRVEKAYRMLTDGLGEKTANIFQYFETSYAKGITDEYIEAVIKTENGQPMASIQDNDSVIFFNFREDRSRELTQAFVLDNFDKFPREKKLTLNFVTMTEYERDLPVQVAFPPEEVKSGLGEILSQAGKKQLRIAETEKYAHVTYFFNGGKEKPWPGEERILIPSPAVARFDEAPAMSSREITDKIIEAIQGDNYDFILLNYANPDMVGHTGDEAACIQAVEAVDQCLSDLIPALLSRRGALLLTADHGNVEEIQNPTTGAIDTEHSTNPIPFWFVSPDNHQEKSAETMMREENQVEGLLSDVAPTILELMDILKPEEMNGDSLLPLLNKQ